MIISELVLEMEDLIQQDQPLVRAAALQADEERGHLGLPAGVDLRPGHGGQRGPQVIGLDVPDQKPVVEEQAIVAPAVSARACSISGQTLSCRRRYSSMRSGRTRNRKQYRAIADHLR